MNIWIMITIVLALLLAVIDLSPKAAGYKLLNISVVMIAIILIAINLR